MAEGTAVFELYYYEDNNEIFDNIMFEYKIKEYDKPFGMVTWILHSEYHNK